MCTEKNSLSGKLTLCDVTKGHDKIPSDMICMLKITCPTTVTLHFSSSPPINHHKWQPVRPPLLKKEQKNLTSHWLCPPSPSPLPPISLSSLHFTSSLLLSSSFPQRALQTALRRLPSAGAQDIPAPWFQSNYVGINDDSPWMHVSWSFCQTTGDGTPGHGNHSQLCRKEGGRKGWKKSFNVKTKRFFFVCVSV